MTAWAFASLVIVLSAGIAAARQGSSQTILLVRAAAQDTFCDRLRAELDALGWFVVEATDEGSREAETEVLAARLHAIAVIRVNEDGSRVELWVRPPNGPAFRETVVVAGSLSPDEAALHTVEGLRARFIRLGIRTKQGGDKTAESPASPAPPIEQPRPSVTPRAAPRTGGAAHVPESHATESTDAEPAVWVRAAPAVSGSPGGFGFGAHALLGARFALNERWSLGGLALVPVTSRTLEAPEGRATALLGMVGADAQYSLTHEAAPASIAVGAGLDFVIVHMAGDATPPFQARSDSVVSAAPMAELAARVRLSRALSLRADLLSGFAVPRPVMRFAGRTVASWGRPFAILSLGLEFGIP